MPRENARLKTKAVQPEQNTLREVIPKIASDIARLDPGPAAALRRGPLHGAGAAAFWKLLAEHDPVVGHNDAGWAALLQAIAILTPKGRDPQKRSAHDYSLPVGRVLWEAGLSELRLARLLSVAPESRRDVAVRTCRRLAAGEFNRFNLVTLGEFVLFGGDRTAHRIARDYYRARTDAERASQDGEVSTNA